MSTVVIMPGGFHPFHAGHLALYQSAQRAFPDAEVFVAATNDTSARPFPFAVKEKLARLAGVDAGHFVQVKSPFRAEEITAQFNPATDTLIFVRSDKDANKPPQAGGIKKDGTSAYLQPLLGAKKLEPFAKHAYMAYLPTVEFGPGMTSATEIRAEWPTLDKQGKLDRVMSLYPRTQGNPKLANTVVKLLDTVIGSEQGVAEGSQEINWVKPNFDFEWHEVEEQSRMKQVPVDVRQYYQKHFPNKDAWLKAVQNGKAVVVPPDHAYEIRNAPFDKESLQKVLAPTGHEGPIGPAKEKRVNDLFDKGQVEMPIILKTSQGLWLIGGKTRLGTANYVKGLPAKVWLISGEQGVAEGADPDKKYTIKKSYTMSKSGVEKSVWYIMDGDFVVDVTDFRRDAKYYADKWNAAEKESSNASQNQHKQGVAEGLLKEFAPGEGGFGPFKVYISNEFIEEFPTFDQAKEEIDFLRTADPKSFDADWKIIDGTGKTVWQHDPGEAIDAMRMRRKIQFNKPDDLKEFAPGGPGGGDSGRWYTDDELADIIGDDWFEDFDVSNDGFNIDTHGEKAKQNLVGYANTWFDDKGYNVNVMGVEHNEIDHNLKWYIVGSFHNPRFANEGVEEGIEFFSTPLRMSEYRGKHHPATEEPYDAKFKFSGDLKDRVHSLLDAGTKPTLLQVNPRHLLATQDWLSTQGGGKPPFATMKQHPVVLQKNNKLYILDGHHRSADALDSGTSIEVYLFKDEL